MIGDYVVNNMFLMLGCRLNFFAFGKERSNSPPGGFLEFSRYVLSG